MASLVFRNVSALIPDETTLRTAPMAYLRSCSSAMVFLAGTLVHAQEGCPATVSDVDGNVYPVVRIGEQCWMAENLRTAHYRNGWHLRSPTDFDWPYVQIGAYLDVGQWGPSLGKLYNWYAVADPRGICPEGWSIPGIDDWTTMMDELGGVDVASHAMRALDTWMPPNTGATNSSGFSAKPAGYFQVLSPIGLRGSGGSAYFWSSTPNTDLTMVAIGLFQVPQVSIFNTPDADPTYVGNALACRCVQDRAVGIDEGSLAPSMRVYPNPFSHRVTVDWEHALPAVLSITDITGRELHRDILNGLSTPIDLQELPAGVHIMHIRGRDNTERSIRVIKQH